MKLEDGKVVGVFPEMTLNLIGITFFTIFLIIYDKQKEPKRL